MPILDARELDKTYADVTILDGVSFTLRRGERVGLVGNNGCGKSTLGRILAGADLPDGGEVARRRIATVDYLAQEPQLPAGQTIRQVVASSLTEWNRAKCRWDDLTAELADPVADHDRLVTEQAAAADELTRLGGWERLHEAEAVIGHLGLDDPDRSVDSLSGGERRRVALARLLVGTPDLAILDEPTNHLDIATIEWLEDYLCNRFAGALLLITHDRYVLDRVTSRTLELEAGRLTSYDGGYAAYLAGRAERHAHAERVEKNRQNFLRRELEWLRRQPKARGTKQKARIGRADQALAQRAPRREETADLRLESERQGKTVLELSDLRLERDGRVLIDGLTLALAAGQRVGVVGPNGCGKTSLLLCLLGELEPSDGTLTLGKNTRIAYLDQARSGLDDDASLRECIAGDRGTIEFAGQTLQVESYLDRFLFDRGAQRLRVGELSGGERARVCLAKLLSQRTNLLLLDEPTNDLDVATLGALEAMLCDYGGSAFIVSHDRWFLDRVATSILAFEHDGRVVLHAGGYSDYVERVANAATTPEQASEAPSTKPQRRAEAKSERPRKLSWSERVELEGLLERVDEAESRVASLEQKLADPATYKQANADIGSLRREVASAHEQVDLLTARWEELEALREG
ncbi:MAG: ATP-binding cassette domain-containing protein [Deltaproteobacteria bacterium]|nr:ATP-binding cassette domain-containing protein [Deltaproteobacteria bacterium]MBW2398957.1 ATP-binding cassette domain-containing protein [Deltaproteobacteria bacterium]